ncbi:unnamed protein product, partial [Ixodes hexagonus]
CEEREEKHLFSTLSSELMSTEMLLRMRTIIRELTRFPRTQERFKKLRQPVRDGYGGIEKKKNIVVKKKAQMMLSFKKSSVEIRQVEEQSARTAPRGLRLIRNTF